MTYWQPSIVFTIKTSKFFYLLS